MKTKKIRKIILIVVAAVVGLILAGNCGGNYMEA